MLGHKRASVLESLVHPTGKGQSLQKMVLGVPDIQVSKNEVWPPSVLH